MQGEMAEAYLKRPAEMLVLEGYCNWAEGILMRSTEALDTAHFLFTSNLGEKERTLIFNALSRFVEVLGLCSICPLKIQPKGTMGMCIDEVMILGLIAGLQYDDRDAAEVCLNTLTCTNRCDEVALAAGEFALTLRSSGMVLFPIPANILSELAADSMPSPSVFFSDVLFPKMSQSIYHVKKGNFPHIKTV